MKTNTKIKQSPVFTHEGGKAANIDAVRQLRRSVMACMLWEGEFYESGDSIANRITQGVAKVSPLQAHAIAVEARSKGNLRHVPLLIASVMARLDTHKGMVADTLVSIIQRADELAEFLAIHAKLNGTTPDKMRKTMSAQIKKGLARAFDKFNAFQLAKYNRDNGIKLRDVAFLAHVKASDKLKGVTMARLVNKDFYPKATKSSGFAVKKEYGLKDYQALDTPDTWETELSAGKDKKTTFTRLINEGKLGALAMLRNLRNMEQAGVERDVIKFGLESMKTDRVLPFRFIAAARVVPQLEAVIEPAMLKSLEGKAKLAGRTALLVDVSSSMNTAISGKSDLSRVDAAYGLAILLREICEDVEVFSFSNAMVQIAPRRGFALADAIKVSQTHGGTYLRQALMALPKKYDRIVIITDEQSADGVDPVQTGAKGYVINVASAKNGVGYGTWNHIDGWSESVVDFIGELEAEDQLESGMAVE